LSQWITSVPGASHVFELGLCTYAERMKSKFLGVSPALLAEHGVVSAPVAAAMVHGLQQQSGATLCLSVTGIAGPGGGTAEQPVGTVYGGLLFRDEIVVAHLKLWELGLKTREEIRVGTAVCLFGLARQRLMEEEICWRKKTNPSCCPDNRMM
jgi:nicotinamide-nucleotide amidase